MRTLFKTLLIIITLITSSNNANAAYPIAKTQQAEINKTALKTNATINKEEQQKTTNKQPKRNNREEDEGIFGILAFIFGLFGIFPAAIVLGIIGVEERRKLKGLAIAGLILGILTLLIYLLVLGILFAL